MKLPVASPGYSQTNEQQARQQIERADMLNLKVGGPIILEASDGSKWELQVDGSGNLSTVAV